MVASELRVAVIGGGIKGCALAAFLSGLNVEVSLFERGLLGGDTTAHNHGRLHLGTAGWHDELDRDALVARRVAGSVVSRQLVDLSEAPEPAYYWFSSDSTDGFEDFLSRHRIPARPVRMSAEDARWLAVPAAKIFELDEYGFDPARFSGRLATVAARSGSVRANTSVERISLSGETVELAVGGDRPRFDVVINTAGRHGASIQVEGREPLVDVSFQTWRVLCGRLSPGRTLRRVFVMGDVGAGSPSLVGHGSVVTFDHKDQPISPPSEQSVGLQRIADDPAGLEMLDRITPYFDLSGLVEDSLRVFTGTQGRIRGAPPGSVGQLHNYPDCTRYHLATGGQASTAVLDALDIVRSLQLDGQLPDSIDGDGLLGIVSNAMGTEVHASTAEMVWRALDDEAGAERS